MNFSSKPVWVILGVPLFVIAAYGGGILGESDKQKFDRLKTGMSNAEVRDVIFPPTGGKYGHMRMDVGENENLRVNDNMIFTMRGGVLVDKQWIGGDQQKKVDAHNK